MILSSDVFFEIKSEYKKQNKEINFRDNIMQIYSYNKKEKLYRIILILNNCLNLINILLKINFNFSKQFFELRNKIIKSKR